MRVRCPHCDTLLKIPDKAIMAERDRIEKDRADTRKAAQDFLNQRKPPGKGTIDDILGGFFR